MTSSLIVVKSRTYSKFSIIIRRNRCLLFALVIEGTRYASFLLTGEKIAGIVDHYSTDIKSKSLGRVNTSRRITYTC